MKFEDILKHTMNKYDDVFKRLSGVEVCVKCTHKYSLKDVRCPKCGNWTPNYEDYN